MANEQSSAMQIRTGKRRIFPTLSCKGAFLRVQHRPVCKASAIRFADLTIESSLGDFFPGV